MLIAKFQRITTALIAFGAVSAGFGTLAGGDQPPARAAPPAVQDSQRNPPEKSMPRLPNAVAEPPGWLGPEAPFDVARFFEAPPPIENAAPLYLDALFEFSGDVAGCFPDGEERTRRWERVRERMSEYEKINTALQEDPESVTDARIDALIARYQDGFRKLAEAQARPRCVFQTGLGLDAVLPHVQAARDVIRIESLRVRRALDRGEIDEAIASIGRSLRLSRDLQPRGYAITQLVSAALERTIFEVMLQPTLASHALKPEHCDRLIPILSEHESKAIDGYTEGLRAEYLASIEILRDLIMHQDELRAILKGFGNEPAGSVVRAIVEPQLISMLARDKPIEKAKEPPPEAGKARDDGEKAGREKPHPEPWSEDTDARIARTTPEEMARQVKRLSDFYRGLLDLDASPYLDRIPKVTNLREKLKGDDLLSRVVEGLPGALEAFIGSMARMEATRRAMPAVVALRRWRLVHDEPPTDLAAALKEAGLPAVPTDPYNGEPFRLTTIDGEPILYAVGLDGDDDGAREESRGGSMPGDVLFGARPKKH